MFVPLYDGTPLRVIRFQFVTIAIILVNVAVYLATGAFTSEASIAALSSGYGVVPAELTGHMTPWHAVMPVPRPLTLVTYMFIHASWWHLIGNMLFLWVFADNIEDAYGYVAFAIFFLICGLAGALTHILLAPTSADALIGASGAVSGVLGAYVVLFPQARVWILLFMRLPLRIGAIWVLGGWFLLQVFNLFNAGEPGLQVALWAHIGGFATGFLLTLALRRRLLLRIAD